MVAGVVRSQTLEEIWPALEIGLDDIFHQRRLDEKRYMQLYTHVYDYCANGPRDDERMETKNPNMDLSGGDVYYKLADYLAGRVEKAYQEAAALNDEDLVRRYSGLLEQYLFYFKVTNGIFSYLNKHWIKRQIEERKGGQYYYVYLLGLVKWRDLFHMKLDERVRRGLLDMIRQDRDGNPTDRALVSKIVRAYVMLGISDDMIQEQPYECKRSDHTFYQDNFEAAFLKETDEYYTIQADKWLQDNPFTIYMQIVERRLADEADRCTQSLASCTRAPLKHKCEEVLIQRKIELYQRDFGPLLEDQRDDDLGRMYKLCSLIENGLKELRTALENHVTRNGLDVLAAVAAKNPNDPREFMSSTLEVYKRYHGLVTKAFQNEPGFIQALDKAAENFINRNAITEHFGRDGKHSVNKVPELIARYCDSLLKKSKDNPDDSEMDDQLQNVINVFKYIQDKDIFQQYYTKLLAKRLIQGLSASDSAESAMISKLKTACGFEYTNKLQRMFNDTEISKDITRKFKEHCKEKNAQFAVDVNVMVLGVSSWPTLPLVEMHLPHQLTDVIEQFTGFYNTMHTGRKLRWSYQQARGELSTNRYPKKYVFLAWTTQMAVLMLYNEQDSYTLSELIALLGIDRPALLPIISSLIKTEVLKSVDVSKDQELTSATPDTTEFAIQDKFQAKKFRVDLMKVQVRSEVKKESDVDTKQIEEDRRVVIEACIVRIMKMRKRLVHNELIAEVIQQLQRRFNPALPKIRAAIDSLIEREFLKRSDESMNIFEYIS
ncbi:unnamed protein product, partial [Mesorhabditis spiculigera]